MECCIQIEIREAPGILKTNFYMFPTENVYIDIFLLLLLKEVYGMSHFNRIIYEIKLRLQSEMY